MKCSLCEKHGKTHKRHAGAKSGRSGLKVLKPRRERVRRYELALNDFTQEMGFKLDYGAPSHVRAVNNFLLNVD